MKNQNLNISLRFSLLLIASACLTTSCAKKYGCFYSTVPMQHSHIETLKPTGALLNEPNLLYSGDQTPNYTAIPAGRQ